MEKTGQKLHGTRLSPHYRTKECKQSLKRNKHAELSDPESGQVLQTEIFPQRTTDFGQNNFITFDLAYYPTENGPYNYDASAADVNANGKLLNPYKKWGGLCEILTRLILKRQC